MLKINLDTNSLKDIFRKILNNCDNTILFYNDKKGKNLNKNKIFSLILFMEKNRNINYYFYNIPFCLFKKFGRNFIDNHLVRNRLCNYYEGYVTYNKCNICRYGLFCNNFNSLINKKSINYLEGFYENELISKEYLLNILVEYKKFIMLLGYKENEFCFYSTQKYIIEFLDGKIKNISKDYLKYLTIYILIGNKKISKELFISLKSFSLVLKDKNIENKFKSLMSKYIININFTLGKCNNIKKYYFNNSEIKLEYYYSRLKYNGRRAFFDFTSLGSIGINSIIEFKGKVFNGLNEKITTKVFIIKKALDLFQKNSDVYIGRDILSGINLNNYKCIIISSDGLGKYGRLIQSLNSIKVPIIYDVKPDLTVYLKDKDYINIDLKTGIIKKL